MHGYEVIMIRKKQKLKKKGRVFAIIRGILSDLSFLFIFDGITHSSLSLSLSLSQSPLICFFHKVKTRLNKKQAVPKSPLSLEPTTWGARSAKILTVMIVLR